MGSLPLPGQRGIDEIDRSFVVSKTLEVAVLLFLLLIEINHTTMLFPPLLSISSTFSTGNQGQPTSKALRFGV